MMVQGWMDELSVERLAADCERRWPRVTLPLPLLAVFTFRGKDRRRKSRTEERKEGGRDEGVNTVTPGVYITSENSWRENIVPVSVGRPWRGLAEDCSVLIPRRTTDGDDCNHGSQMRTVCSLW